ncbi:MAG TPA: bifunctional phosphopantothenoylcysteine decarboxylase/phosphopantothenate--cysteine ligase CoaBC [Solirubrobacteraceae bacterium]|jgi:phosphopantothenoylcysteine decarboxylase/phosphopantothenate--cysteine ligase|nr:bifunctional phosphopantothenoylcysteine decarboxylase/phosphopantothenate--cysteine ligase CoaBC [Solirubrobacteraceae bacterium]
MSRILLGVSGGIAAYKALELVRLATAAGHALRVVQTPASRRFVGEASFAALSGAPVLLSEFERDPARGAFPDQRPPEHEPLSHLELVANADVYLIAPASANTIAKLAAGLADNLLTSCALAASCPVVVAPAMNSNMYAHPATRANIQALRERGVRIVEPGTGRLASKGEHGVGRLAEPARLLAACEAAASEAAPTDAPARSGSLSGVGVLVTAGGTREAIDSVRYIGNSSSGRMGLALAQAAQARGAQVTLIAANVPLSAPPGVIVRPVVSAAELQQACVEEFPRCEILLMAAAVADFRPVAAQDGKIKKAERKRLELVLEPTADVLSGLAASRRDGQTLIGFAAEHGERAAQGAREKLAAKGIDAIVVNDISRADIGFDADENEVTILSALRDGSELEELHVPRASKIEVAEAILDAAERLRASR